jgi:hypothetical protein
MQDLEANGALVELWGFLRPLRLLDLKLRLAVPAVKLALVAVGADGQLRVEAPALKSK